MTEVTVFSLIFFIFLSGVFSGSEAALFSLDPSRFKVLFKDISEKKSKIISEIQKWLNHPEQTLAAILLGNLAVNVLISNSASQLLDKILEPGKYSAWFELSIITILILIFAELLPKVIAIKFAVPWALFWNKLLSIWFWISRIVTNPVARFTRWIASRLKLETVGLNETQLRQAITIATEEKLLNESEQKLLNRSVSFYYDTAFSVMVPRNKVFSIACSLTPLQAKKLFLKNNHPMSVVVREGKVIGFLHARNLVHAIHRKQKSLRNRIQPILFMPQTMSLKKVLEMFISRRSEVAAVLDESGEFSGIITLKDVLKKITGELDEKEISKSQQIISISETTFKVNGQILLDNFNEFFHSELFSKEAETLNGYLLEQLDGFPDNSSIVEFDQLQFYNMQVKNYQIDSVSVKVISK